LGALGGFNAAQTNQLKSTQEQLEIQKAQAEAAQAAQQQQVFSTLPENQKQVAMFPGLASFQDKAAIQLNNKNAVAAFQAQYPNDPKAAAFSSSYVDSPKAVSPGDIDADYQAHLQGPGKMAAQTADITEKQAATARDKAEAAHIGQPTPKIENWYNPNTKSWRQGTSPNPGEIPETVVRSAKSDQEVKARAAAWQKAYTDAKNSYIKTGTTTSFFGDKTPPSEADVDAYARQQADSQVNALYGATGTAAGVAAETSGAPPLPEGSSSYAVDDDGNVGHVDSSGKFVPF
jgi:hypothetical protein